MRLLQVAFVILYFTTVSFTFYNYEEEFAMINSKCSPEPQCWFNFSEITSKTIDFFPKCCYVCGIVTLNQNTDVSPERLKTAFSEFEYLKGGLHVENTSFQDLSFFAKLRDFSTRANLGISIINNSFLTDNKFFYQTAVSLAAATPLLIINNTKLDVSDICEYPPYHKFMEKMYVVGNLKDCGCRGEDYGTPKFVNCTAVFGHLNITNKTQKPKFLATLANVKNITGNITVSNTSLQNLSFFKSLQNFRVSFRGGSPNLDLHDNPKMTRFGFKYFNILDDLSTFYMNVQDLNPKFCLTTDEMEFLVMKNTMFNNIEAVLCPIESEPNGPKFCHFDVLSSLANDCVKVIGDVLIAAGDESHVDKIKTVTHIFGSLRVQNTNLTNLDFFTNLRQVIQMNGTNKAIQITSSPHLQHLKFPNLTLPYNRGTKEIVIEDCPLVFDNAEECDLFQKSVLIWVNLGSDTCYTYNFTGPTALTPGSKEWLNNEETGTGNTNREEKLSESWVFRDFLILVIVSYVF